MILPNGEKVTSLTIEQLASLGVVPDMTGNGVGIEQLGDSGGGFFAAQ